MSSLKSFTKQPGDHLDYDLDYEPFFDNPDFPDNDNIDSSGAVTVVVSPQAASPSLQCTSHTAIGAPDSRRVKVWLSEGIDGADYKVTVTITTHDGRVKEKDFTMKVRAE